MDPKIWGANMWYILHIITFTYPTNPSENDKTMYHDFFHLLKHVIPCDDCKKHYAKFIAQYPITPHLDTKANLIKWLIQIHNFVNISLNKPIYAASDVLKLYMNLKPVSPFDTIDERLIIEKKIDETKEKLIYCLLGIAAILIVFVRHSYKKNYYYYK